jgi:hypothetical protein
MSHVGNHLSAQFARRTPKEPRKEPRKGLAERGAMVKALLVVFVVFAASCQNNDSSSAGENHSPAIEQSAHEIPDTTGASSSNPVFGFVDGLHMVRQLAENVGGTPNPPVNDVVIDMATRTYEMEEEADLSGKTINGYSAKARISSSVAFRPTARFVGEANGCEILSTDGLIFLTIEAVDTSTGQFATTFGPVIEDGGNGYSMDLLTSQGCVTLSRGSTAEFPLTAAKSGATWNAALVVKNLCQGRTEATPDDPFGRPDRRVLLNIQMASAADGTYGGWGVNVLDPMSVFDAKGIQLIGPYSYWSESPVSFLQMEGDNCSVALLQ